MRLRRRLARLGAALAGILVALGAAAPPAAAHAELVATTPGDRARLTEAPTEVRLEFNESVSASLGAVRVFDHDGDRVDDGHVDVSGAIVTAPLRAGLGDGGYVVAYRVVSADAHPVRGAVTFTVGDGPEVGAGFVADVFDRGADRPWEIAGFAARAAAYAGVLLAAGLALFLVLAHDGEEAERLRLGRYALAAAAVGAAGIVLELPARAALVTGLGLSSIMRSGVLADVLGDNVVAGIVITLAGVAGTLLGMRTGSRTAVGSGAVLAVGGFAVAGHTTTSDPRWLATAGAAVHLVAASVWFGGLVGLIVCWRARRRTEPDPAPLGAVVARFSGLAGAALAGVIVAGGALAWSEVRAIDALTGTTYGRLLLIKLTLVAAVALLGAYNRFRLVPILAGHARQGASAAWRQLGATLRVEAGALVVVVAVTAGLVNVTPARNSISEPFSTTVAFGTGSVNVVVDPARPGPTTMHLYLLDGEGRPVDYGDALTVELALPENDIGPIDREPLIAGPGHYQLLGRDFSLAGHWTVTVRARVTRFDELTARADVHIG